MAIGDKISTGGHSPAVFCDPTPNLTNSEDPTPTESTHSLEYWRNRCKAAERVIETSFRNPNIFPAHIKAHQNWQWYKNQRPSEKPVFEKDRIIPKISGPSGAIDSPPSQEAV